MKTKEKRLNKEYWGILIFLWVSAIVVTIIAITERPVVDISEVGLVLGVFWLFAILGSIPIESDRW